MPLTDHVWRAAAGHQVHPPLTAKADGLAHSVHAFHWPLEFPDILARGGFDVVLGNPPWIRQELLGSIKPLLILFKSFNTTADSSVYFVERSIQICRCEGRVSMITPNKWFKASYGTRLRTFVRQHCRAELVVDFGHSRTLFPDADTFPAALTFAPVTSSVCDHTTLCFVRAHDSDRECYPLEELIGSKAVVLSHRNLRYSRWDLQDTSASALLDRLTTTGNPLESVLRAPLLRGLLTGFNEAFYVDTRLRDELVASDSSSEHLFKQLIRGRDVGRWTASWQDQWHIVIKSSQNHRWPWSNARTESDAEMVFEETYPSVYNHLKNFKERLVARKDKGVYWWELRPVDTMTNSRNPKSLSNASRITRGLPSTNKSLCE